MALKAFYVAVNVTAGRVGLVQVNETVRIMRFIRYSQNREVIANSISDV